MQEFRDFLEVTDEVPVEEFQESAGNKNINSMFPAVLVMRRKAIRQYPGNKTVALYFIDKLNKYVAIPQEQGNNLVQTEGTEFEGTVIDHLKHIASNSVEESVKFDDGKTEKVSVQTANAILRLLSALNEENKIRVSELAQNSKIDFGKVVDFAWKHLK